MNSFTILGSIPIFASPSVSKIITFLRSGLDFIASLASSNPSPMAVPLKPGISCFIESTEISETIERSHVWSKVSGLKTNGFQENPMSQILSSDLFFINVLRTLFPALIRFGVISSASMLLDRSSTNKMSSPVFSGF